MAVNISAAVYSFFDIKFSDLLLIMVYLLYFFISLVFIFISSGDRQYIKHQLKYKDREYKDSSKFLYYYLSFFFLFLNLCSIILYYYSILSFFLLLFLKNYILEIINIFIILQNFCDYNLFPLNFDVLIFSLEQFYENSILFSLNSDVFDSIMFYATIFLIIFLSLLKIKNIETKCNSYKTFFFPSYLKNIKT